MSPPCSQVSGNKRANWKKFRWIPCGLQVTPLSGVQLQGPMAQGTNCTCPKNVPEVFVPSCEITGRSAIWFSRSPLTTYNYRRKMLRLHDTILYMTPAAHSHTSSNNPSRPPRSSQDGSRSGFSIAMKRSTSLTVTSPDNAPWSSTNMMRGLKWTLAFRFACAKDEHFTHPIRLNSCITISRGSCGDTVIGVWSGCKIC